ncbi:MAG: hypothetical protein LQ347_005681, partial [Umbilicaria vellea]
MVEKLLVPYKGMRAIHNKVKTGCNTCKIRRVKCDEQKPECFRCRETGRKCDGYATEGLTSRVKNLNSPDLARDKFTTPLERGFFLFSMPGSIASNSISFDLPGSGKERRSFHYFRNQTIPDLSGYFQSGFWDRLVLQFCHAEPAVRHALIALGAVHETFKTIGDYATKTGRNEWECRFSLQQYNRAITKLRKHLSTKGHQSVEVALICCLLFICFESLLGNHESALCHLESGIDILRGWRARNVHLSSSNIWSPSSESDIIEDHLVQVFSRLDMQATLLLDTRVPQCQTIQPIHGNIALDCIPTRFVGLSEARSVLDKIGNQLALFIITNHPDPDLPPDSVSSATKMEQTELTARLEGWSQAYDDLLTKTSTMMTVNELRGAILLRMHRKALSLILAGGVSVSERVFDRFTGTFAEIISLSESLLKSKGRSGFAKGSPTFALDLGIVAPLYMTARKCTDPIIRQRAVSLLHASARREAFWDGAMAAKVAEQVEAEHNRMVPGGVLELAQKYGVKRDRSIEKRCPSTQWVDLRTPTTVERSLDYNSPKLHTFPTKSLKLDTAHDTFAIAEDPPSSPFVEVVDLGNRSPTQVKSASRSPSPKKQSPERRIPIPLTEAALRENEGLTRAIETLEVEAAANGRQGDQGHKTTLIGGGAQGYAGMDDTCFSTFSELPDMTQFARAGRSPTKSVTGSPAKQMRGAQYRNSVVTPGQSVADTPGTTRRDGDEVNSRSPSPTPRGPKTFNGNDTTNLILDFTEQFNAIAPNSTRSPTRGKRSSISPIKFAPQREVSWGSRGRMTSPGKQMYTPSTPSETRSFANLLDFDIPPAPTPRSIPTVSARELESLKATFLSQISSLRATLNGKEAEINSLKEAVSDAERRVGEAFENVREERNAKESLQHEKVNWEIRDKERHEVILSVKEQIFNIEHQRDELTHKLADSDNRLSEAETKLSEAETRIAALRATTPCTPSGSETSASEPAPNKSPGHNKAIEAAVERVARDLHGLYKGKHETKVAALKKSYETRWSARIQDLESQLSALSTENTQLKTSRDTSTISSPPLPTPPAPAAVETEWDKQLRAAEAQHLEEERARLEAEMEGLKGELAGARAQVARERVEKGELVRASEEMLEMLAAQATVHAHPAGAPATGAGETRRGSVIRSAGLKALARGG